MADVNVVDSPNLVKKYHSDATNVRLVNTVLGFLGAELAIVRYDEADRKDIEVYFLKTKTGGQQLFSTASELAEYTAVKKEKLMFYQYLVSVVGISGIIAIALTAVIIGLLVNNPQVQLPTILTSSLSTILGFYFGSAGRAVSPT
jgi:hypothetical protein